MLNYKKILITGGAGFIGSNFVHYVAEKYPETKIVVLDKLTYAGNLQNLDGLQERITFIKGDICDSQTVLVAMHDCQAVVHFAAESHVDRSIKTPEIFVTTNVLGTQVLLDAALKTGVQRFHHISTDEVFGSLPLQTKEKWTEQSPYAPRSPYSASKAAADHLVRAYYVTYGLPVTITNCANNIGPYMFPEKLIPLAITNFLRGKKTPLYKPGNQIREWLYVTDHLKAIELVLIKGKVGETYFVGPDNEEHTNLEILQKILKIMNLPESYIELVDARPGHDARYAMDHSKITNELGFRPEVGLNEALEKMVEWYTKNRQWWESIILNT